MNVLVVNHFIENMQEILPAVLKELRKAGDGHRYRLVHDVKPAAKHFAWTFGKPTLVISLRAIRNFLPKWATVLQSQPLTKVQELEMLEAAGVPVPKWAAFGENEQPDLSGFGDYVVVKPSRGARGALVRIMKNTRVRWEPLQVRDLGFNEQLIAQEYVHTGPWPVCYRVGTVFSEPVYKFRVKADAAREPIEFNPSAKLVKSGDRTFSGFGGKTIVASSKGCSFDEDVPADIVELASQAHAAFPHVPLLGTDIVRDSFTEKIYVVEVNAIGGTFNPTSDSGKNISREFGLDLKMQLGGPAAVARGVRRGVAQWVSGISEKSNIEKEVFAS